MLGLAQKTRTGEQLRSEVAAYLYDVFAAEDGALATLDRWTQRRIVDENMAKLTLVLESEEPIEYCYQNLVREIDTEAEAGIFLVNNSTHATELSDLAKDPGISGKLHEHMETIAPVMFADELSHSHRDMDIVWVSIQARYDRAKIDASVSETILARLIGEDNGAADMSNALRSLLYSFHEDLARRLCSLPAILNDRSTRELIMMISELAERAGNYSDRVDAIIERAASS